MSKPGWAEERAKRIGEEIRALRGKRSGQWLADETASHGHAISRTTISELENGKRKDVTLAEITVLARALRVSPIQMIYPDLADGPTEIWPNVTATSFEAAQWFSGELRASDIEESEAAHDSDNAKVQMSRRLARLRQNVRNARLNLTTARFAPHALLAGSEDAEAPVSEEQATKAVENARELLTQQEIALKRQKDAMRAEGLVVDDAKG
ncbi:helix-turn-helix domain-containing protein [Nocardia farcinica]|uniref:helix-turn-helix domain-containing protein n=1 Tax=Nocardia farcinica TaxID=37329 RepID=UPI0024584EC9|nr:helix-turn-helix transcriptional regulator [Nocardia farcinica]